MGQVLFPSQVVSRICDLIDAGILFGSQAQPDCKQEHVLGAIKEQFDAYPVDKDRLFTVVYCTRQGSGMQCRYFVSALSWCPTAGWHHELLPIPHTSGIIKAWGSGEAAVERWYKHWLSTRQGGRTSRSVFSAFCDALASGDDPFSGGAPQLVGLYRQGVGETFGVVFEGVRYILGVPIQESALVTSVEWRNALFERCDGYSMERVEGAQRHARPKGLGRTL